MSIQDKAGKVLVTWLDSTDTETSSKGLLAFSREIAVMWEGVCVTSRRSGVLSLKFVCPLD